MDKMAHGPSRYLVRIDGGRSLRTDAGSVPAVKIAVQLTPSEGGLPVSLRLLGIRSLGVPLHCISASITRSTTSFVGSAACCGPTRPGASALTNVPSMRCVMPAKWSNSHGDLPLQRFDSPVQAGPGHCGPPSAAGHGLAGFGALLSRADERDPWCGRPGARKWKQKEVATLRSQGRSGGAFRSLGAVLKRSGPGLDRARPVLYHGSGPRSWTEKGAFP